MRHVLLLLTVTLTSAGCASVRAAREAQDPAMAVAGERTPTAMELGLPRSGPLDVDEAVRAALGAHPSVLQARRALEAAEARLGQARSAYWPQLATGSVQVARQGSHARGETEWDTSTTLGLQLSWLVYDFGRTPALVQSVLEDLASARLELARTELEVAFAVRSAYFSLEEQLQLALVAAETVTQFERREEQVLGFVEVGTRIRYDLTKARADLASARLDLLRATNRVEVARATLASAIGLAEEVAWTVPERPLAAFGLTLDEAWARGRTLQPTITAAQAREAAASALVDAQVAALYPALRLTAGYSASGVELPLASSWSLGPAVSWTIFDGLQNLYSIDEAAANLRAARAARAQAEQRVWLGLRTAFANHGAARERLDVARLGAASAEQNLGLAQGRYEVGLGTAVDLTDAQTIFARARAELVQARADHDTAVADLWRWIAERPAPPGAGP